MSDHTTMPHFVVDEDVWAIRFLILAIASAVLTGLAYGQDQVDGFRLDVQSGPGFEPCVDSESLRARVRTRLGPNAFAKEDRAVISIRVSEESTFMAIIAVQGGSSATRKVYAKSCEELVSALELLITMTIESVIASPDEPANVDTAKPVSDPPRVVASEAAASTNDVATTIPVSKKKPDDLSSWRIVGGISGLLGTGSVASISTGGRGSLAIEWQERAQVGLLVSHWLTETSDTSPGITLRRNAIGVEGCGKTIGVGVWSLWGCGRLRVSNLSVEGFGFRDNASASQFQLLSVLGVRADRELGSGFGMSLGVLAEVTLNPYRTEFVLEVGPDTRVVEKLDFLRGRLEFSLWRRF